MKNEEIEKLVIEIGSNGGNFLGEHGLVHRPTLEFYVEKLKKIIRLGCQEGVKEK